MADIVFMALHGENGENGKIQAAFDLFGIRYTGSDYLSSAIAMNKETSKQFFLANGIPAPKGISMTRDTREDDVTKLELTLPCVVKTMLWWFKCRCYHSKKCRRIQGCT